MNILSYIFKKTLLYRIYSTIKSGYRYIVVNDSIGKFIHSEDFFIILKKYLKVDFNQDWIGRIYGVINPYVNIDEQLDMSSMIVEIDGDNTNNDEQIEQWVYKQLALIYQLFKMRTNDVNNLFQEVTIDIKHVGPANHPNFLIVLDLVQRKDFTNKLKKLLIHISIYSILIMIGLIFIL